jgi:23S rRNA pseudouridine1911/1915/1917 synthase
MAVRHDGRPAVTRYTLLEDFDSHSLLAVEPQTGRTHQIRIHLAWLGHPVVGDLVYGFRKQRIKMKRFFLHAAELELDSPSTGERLKFEAPLPAGLQNVLDKLRQNQRKL